MFSFLFRYNDKGCGHLCLFDDSRKVSEYASRTGSIKETGALQNALPAQEYSIKDEPVSTIEHGMFFTIPSNGWKVRLYNPNYTHYLIHPDGGKGGTLGCIGIIGTDALPLKAKIADILKSQKEIPVKVEKI